jgi:hypothetical protein
LDAAIRALFDKRLKKKNLTVKKQRRKILRLCSSARMYAAQHKNIGLITATPFLNIKAEININL